MTQNKTSVVTQQVQTESASDQFVRMIVEYAFQNGVTPSTAMMNRTHMAVWKPLVEQNGLSIPPSVDLNRQRSPQVRDLPMWQPRIPSPIISTDDGIGEVTGINMPAMSPITELDVPNDVLWLSGNHQPWNILDIQPGTEIAIPAVVPIAIGQFAGQGITTETFVTDPARIASLINLSQGAFVVQATAGEPIGLQNGALRAIPLLARITIRRSRLASPDQSFTNDIQGLAVGEVQVVYYDPMLILADHRVLNQRFYDHFQVESAQITSACEVFNNISLALTRASIASMSYSVSGAAMLEYLGGLLSNRRKGELNRGIRDSVVVMSQSAELLMQSVRTFLDSMISEAVTSGYCPMSVDEMMFMVDAMNAFFDGLDVNSSFAGHPTRLAELVAQMRRDLKGG
jgi:hypothetical protein